MERCVRATDRCVSAMDRCVSATDRCMRATDRCVRATERSMGSCGDRSLYFGQPRGEHSSKASLWTQALAD